MFTGQSGCYCCGDSGFWIRKYDDSPTMNVIAEADIAAFTSGPTLYPIVTKISARNGKITVIATDSNYVTPLSTKTLWVKYDYNLGLISNLTIPRPVYVSHTNGDRLAVGTTATYSSRSSRIPYFVSDAAEVYESGGSLVFTFTPSPPEKVIATCLDSANNLYTLTLSEIPPYTIAQFYLYKHNSSGVLQWKGYSGTNSIWKMEAASDDYIWTARKGSGSILQVDRWNPSGGFSSASSGIAVTGDIYDFAYDNSGGMWLALNSVTIARWDSGLSKTNQWNGSATTMFTVNDTSSVFLNYLNMSFSKYSSTGTLAWSWNYFNPSQVYWGNTGANPTAAIYSGTSIFMAGARVAK